MAGHWSLAPLCGVTSDSSTGVQGGNSASRTIRERPGLGRDRPAHHELWTVLDRPVPGLRRVAESCEFRTQTGVGEFSPPRAPRPCAAKRHCCWCSQFGRICRTIGGVNARHFWPEKRNRRPPRSVQTPRARPRQRGLAQRVIMASDLNVISPGSRQRPDQWTTNSA